MSKGLTPPARRERCARGPKNITAQSTPLAVRRTATRRPEGNCFGISLGGLGSLNVGALWRSPRVCEQLKTSSGAKTPTARSPRRTRVAYFRARAAELGEICAFKRLRDLHHLVGVVRSKIRSNRSRYKRRCRSFVITRARLFWFGAVPFGNPRRRTGDAYPKSNPDRHSGSDKNVRD